MNRINFRKTVPIILSIISAVGVAATTISAVRATPRALSLIKEKELETGKSLNRIEVVKTAAPCYISTVVIGTSTIACVIGACVFNQKQQAAYISAYTLLQQSFKEYRSTVCERFAIEADSDIRSEVVNKRHRDESITPPSDEKLVFYEAHRDEFFELTKEEVILAEYHLNRNFKLRGWTTLNEFYEFLGLSKTDAGDILGWGEYQAEVEFGCLWIDFYHEKHQLDDGLEYYIIEMPFPPTADYDEW